MSDDRIKSLEVKIESLEKKHEGLAKGPEISDVSAEELRAYQKVSALLDPACGINECQRCIVLRCGGGFIRRCVVRCINECNCGPCNPGYGGGFFGGGFGSLGE
jgi:hypothetical protein